MYGVLMTRARPWPSEQTRLTGAEVRRYREGRMTADQLAAAVTDLGMRYTRAQVTNLEAGRRDSITTGELAILSAALGVPRLLLEYPLGRVDVVEVLPGIEVSPLVALHWAETGRLGARYADVVQLARDDVAHLIKRYRRHAELIEAWWDARGRMLYTRHGPQRGEGDDAAAELARIEQEQRFLVGSLWDLRDAMRSRKLIPPELPAELAYLDQEGALL